MFTFMAAMLFGLAGLQLFSGSFRRGVRPCNRLGSLLRKIVPPVCELPDDVTWLQLRCLKRQRHNNVGYATQETTTGDQRKPAEHPSKISQMLYMLQGVCKARTVLEMIGREC